MFMLQPGKSTPVNRTENQSQDANTFGQSTEANPPENQTKVADVTGEEISQFRCTLSIITMQCVCMCVRVCDPVL